MQEGSWIASRFRPSRAFLCGVCIFSQCLRGFLPLRRHRLGGLEILGDVPSCMVVGVGGLLWKSSVSEYFLFESSHIQESLDLMALVSVIANLPIFKKKLIDYKMSICSLNSALWPSWVGLLLLDEHSEVSFPFSLGQWALTRVSSSHGFDILLLENVLQNAASSVFLQSKRETVNIIMNEEW